MCFRLGVLGGFAAVLIGATGGTAQAQIIFLTDVQYTPATERRPAAVESKGAMSLPADGNVYRVYCDYGRFGDGRFTPVAKAGKGGSSRMAINAAGVNPHVVTLFELLRDSPVPLTLGKAGGKAEWCVAAPHCPTDPGSKLYLRARIQMLCGGDWFDVPQAVAMREISTSK
jgi:hypothetical protein